MNTTKRTLYQAALLQSLVLGHYEGFIPVKDLMGHGDFGIGTFDSLEGDLVMVDGQVYQVNGRGEVKKPEGNVKVPFADVFFFEPDRELPLEHISSLAKLRGGKRMTSSIDGERIIFMVSEFVEPLKKCILEAKKHSRNPTAAWMKP